MWWLIKIWDIQDWRNITVGGVHPIQAKDMRFSLQSPCENVRQGSIYLQPSTGEAEAEGSLELSGQPVCHDYEF